MPDTFSPTQGELPVDSVSMKESSVAPLGSSPAELLSLAARGQPHVEAALTACVHAEANLFAMVRTIQDVAITLQSAVEAKDEVRVEVECLRSLLQSAEEEQRAFKERVTLLEQALDRSKRERSLSIDETDAFIAELCNEHERVVSQLEQRVAALQAREDAEIRGLLPPSRNGYGEELEPRLKQAEAELLRLADHRNSAQRSLLRLEAQRDEALAQAVRATRERDQLQHELSNYKASVPNLRGLAYRDTLRITRTPPGGIAVAPPEQPASLPRGSDALEERPAMLPGAREALESSTGAPSSRTSLRQKPDLATRPLVGYSLAGDSVPEEQTTPRSSETPER